MTTQSESTTRLICPSNFDCEPLKIVQDRTEIERIESYPSQITDKVLTCVGECAIAKFAVEELAQRGTI